ncbi:MAG: hypothetical protein IPP29_16270 [Bacteroidetes bacterium]|nr:hypothetical protein [Bacteroidota bacterium]
MEANTIIQEIKKLSIIKPFYILEETLKSIKNDELNNHLELAAESMVSEYTHNKELTAFTALDLEKFYESK